MLLQRAMIPVKPAKMPKPSAKVRPGAAVAAAAMPLDTLLEAFPVAVEVLPVREPEGDAGIDPVADNAMVGAADGVRVGAAIP